MSKHVFIIENNELLVMMYRSIFQALACGVTHAATLDEALRWLPGLKADLVILDARLADGAGMVDGRKLRLTLKSMEVPIIATVSRLSTYEDDAVRNAGYAAIVTKPFQISAFSTLVKSYIDRVSPSGSALQ